MFGVQGLGSKATTGRKFPALTLHLYAPSMTLCSCCRPLHNGDSPRVIAPNKKGKGAVMEIILLGLAL